jgi:tetratricopeptide (TPR) repeat protein
VDYENGGFWVFAVDDAPATRPHPLYFLPETEGLFFPAVRDYTRRRMDLAVPEAEATAARLPGVANGRMILAKLYAAAGDYERTYQTAAPLVATGFIGDGLAKHVGAGAINTGRFAAGVRAYCAAWRLTRDPGLLVSLGYGFYRLGLAARREGRGERAARDLEQAVRCAPDQPSVRAAWADALAGLGRRGDALREARRAAALAPGDLGIAALVRSLTPP